MCTTARAKKLIVGLTLVAVAVGCMFTNQDHLRRYYVTRVTRDVVYVAFYVVVPVTVLIINVVLIREVRRAANKAAANLGLQQHHQSTTSNSAVPTVMLITTSLVYVLLLEAVSITSLIVNFLTSSVFLRKFLLIVDTLSRNVFAYNFYVYLISGKQFRSELRTLFCRSSYPPSSAADTSTAAVAHDRNDARLTGRRCRSNSYPSVRCSNKSTIDILW